MGQRCQELVLGAVGICEHALAEVVVYMRHRILYGKPVTDMPHIRAATAVGAWRTNSDAWSDRSR